MKKLIVLLLAFAVAGVAFAQTPVLSAYSTLSFGVDLDTMQAGFKNYNSATVTVNFPVANVTKKGDKGWWGEIAVANVNFKLSDDAISEIETAPVFTNTYDYDGDGVVETNGDDAAASVTAKITNGVWVVSVSSMESFDYANADALSDGDVAVALHADTMGVTLGHTENGLSVGVTAASKGDWTANTLNEFAFGTNASYKVSDALTVSGAFAYDALDASKDLGATATVALALGDLSASVVGDAIFTAGFVADALVSLDYAVMDGLDAALDVYYSMSDSDIEVEAAVDYAAGAIEAGVWFGDYNALTGATYDLGVYAGYTHALGEKTSLYVYAEYTNDLAGAQALVPYFELSDTSIANTTLSLEYNADEVDVLAGAFGTLIASATVTL